MHLVASAFVDLVHDVQQGNNGGDDENNPEGLGCFPGEISRAASISTIVIVVVVVVVILVVLQCSGLQHVA